MANTKCGTEDYLWLVALFGFSEFGISSYWMHHRFLEPTWQNWFVSKIGSRLTPVFSRFKNSRIIFQNKYSIMTDKGMTGGRSHSVVFLLFLNFSQPLDECECDESFWIVSHILSEIIQTTLTHFHSCEKGRERSYFTNFFVKINQITLR